MGILLCVFSLAILNSCEPSISPDTTSDTEETPDSGSNSDKDDVTGDNDEPPTGGEPSTPGGDDNTGDNENPEDNGNPSTPDTPSTPGGDDNTGDNENPEDNDNPSTPDTPSGTVDHSYTYWNKCITQTTTYLPDGTSISSTTETRRTFNGYMVMSEETYTASVLSVTTANKYDGLTQTSTMSYPSVPGYTSVQTTTYKDETFLYPLTTETSASRTEYTYDNQGRQTSWKSYSNGYLFTESTTTYQGSTGVCVTVTYDYGTTNVATRRTENIQYLDSSCKDAKSSEATLYTTATNVTTKYQTSNTYQNNRIIKSEQYVVQNNGQKVLFYSSTHSYSDRHQTIEIKNYCADATNTSYQLGSLMTATRTEYNYIY